MSSHTSRRLATDNPPLKIAIAVHGRFHAFDMARELLRRGHEVRLFTNYPKFAVERFGVPTSRVRTLVAHGICSRLAQRMQQRGLALYPEARLQRWFGRWAAAQVAKEAWDVVVCWSGIGEETFQTLKGTQTLLICQRGSAHIRVQAALLAEEAQRTGQSQDQPSSWIISREEREYAGCDLILVPSSFAADTFVAQGLSQDKVVAIPLAVDTRAFRPERAVIAARCQRILAGKPLRVLNVGTFSFRKGVWDLPLMFERLSPETFEFRFVGPVATECHSFAEALSAQVSFTPKQAQADLPQQYAWGDIFILPTIEDGYAMVLDQAAAAALPILATTNSGGPDLVEEDKTGWILPIRCPEAFAARLQWCHEHRHELAGMVSKLYDNFQARDWSDMAADFARICRRRLAERPGEPG